MRTISGVWLPIITPFVDGAVDVRSYERLLEHYLGKGVSGVFPVGTTGESPALDDDEIDAIVERTVAVVAGRVPVFVGIGGNAFQNLNHGRLRRQQRDQAFDQRVTGAIHEGAPPVAKSIQSDQ